MARSNSRRRSIDFQAKTSETAVRPELVQSITDNKPRISKTKKLAAQIRLFFNESDLSVGQNSHDIKSCNKGNIDAEGIMGLSSERISRPIYLPYDLFPTTSIKKKPRSGADHQKQSHREAEQITSAKRREPAQIIILLTALILSLFFSVCWCRLWGFSDIVSFRRERKRLAICKEFS